MGWIPTLGLTAGCLITLLFCAWRDTRPPDLVKGPRMAPYRPIMIITVVLLLMLVVHMVNLLGVQTGRN